ncbi:MAG: hypothetical protein FJX72_17365, partial [Armatimonadetes bacterium]|nr:hypothetical protein [Armatimonadota bacterium]
MGVVRCFMGWDRPAIEGVVAYLSRERPRTHTPAHLQPPQWDLSDIVVAVPTSRFGRRLLERLAETAQAPASPCALIPPAVVTLGALEEHLWPSPIRRATATEETLAWIAAMRTVGRSAMEDVLPVPQDDAPLGWFALADLLSRAHTGLAREGRTMQDAAEAVRRIGAGRDRARWTVLSHVEDAFGAVMERAGLTPRSTVWRR